MAKSDAPNIQRRQLLKFSGVLAGGAALSGLSSAAVAKSSEGTSSFKAPTPDSPIRICWNENPLGMSPKAQAVARETVAQGNRYPFESTGILQKLIADDYGLSPDHVLLTAGATEGIRAAIEALAAPDIQLVCPALTFDSAEENAKVNGITKITKVPMLKDWGIDLPAMKKAVADYDGPSVVYFVNPNNPTGAICKADEVEAWIKSKPAKTIFLMDEAYAEFADDKNFRSCSPLLTAGADNIILLKTFSKLFAMAGMRVGWAVSTPEMIGKLREKTASNALNFPAVKAAIASWQDKEFIKLSQVSNKTSREILLQALHALKLEYVPSNTNFIFHKVAVPLAEYQKQMKAAGILVGRAFPPADDYCRVSLGTPEEMTYVAKTMLELRKKGLV
ncbi:aminotransferase class I/II-fold pyridoxal phosphate-dependent enzyme [Shewanella avicenniae]|uniref:Aminotransferase class I/II-fold pyridoxal phosphate-dependent enzyme n=1 Tax=Shewanella avicenniae TaxID=2814294 RepID=A0ABX7QV76_9GAMM|nr:aminotransferase class I/II-fold pyridoxal phosphate-dependent enzyme [Shewanella avicenniae]QSX35403.1 aminotransferase class I/II-fold pyridoxal phosphate-dependent enzyme [Shewanella avicenniae]